MIGPTMTPTLVLEPDVSGGGVLGNKIFSVMIVIERSGVEIRAHAGSVWLTTVNTVTSVKSKSTPWPAKGRTSRVYIFSGSRPPL